MFQLLQNLVDETGMAGTMASIHIIFSALNILWTKKIESYTILKQNDSVNDSFVVPAVRWMRTKWHDTHDRFP